MPGQRRAGKLVKNKRVVNMSGVKKDQGGMEEETSTSKRTGPSHFRVGMATDLNFEALLCPVFLKSVTKKHPSEWGFSFF